MSCLHTVTGVHLVGSLPFHDEEETFRQICRNLPDRVNAIPDGETGIRAWFTRWQINLFKSEPTVLNPALRMAEGSGFTVSQVELEQLCQKFDHLETQYDVHALASYKTFCRLREDGVIPRGVRFLVSLPTPLTAVAFIIRPSLRGKMERLYENAIFRALARVQDAIPAHDLAIQWDSVGEVFMMENVTFLGEQKPWFTPLFEGIVDRYSRLAGQVKEGVDMGFHLCYGDAGHKHAKEPESLAVLSQMVTGIMGQSPRPVNWIHVPVPKDRNDAAYFTPLTTLSSCLGSTRLVLGLVHENDMSGTISRIETASHFVKTFEVSTECGMGRVAPEDIGSVFEICAQVCQK